MHRGRGGSLGALVLAVVCACGGAGVEATSGASSSSSGAPGEGSGAASPTTGALAGEATSGSSTAGESEAAGTTGGGTTLADASTSETTSGDATTGEAAPFVVYLDPGGDDARGGLTPADAVLTLARAQAIVEAAAPERDVEVRIAQGTYVGQSVKWTYYHPVFRVAFMPVDYAMGDGIDDIAGRPVFDGDGASSWLSLEVAEGERTGLEFYYLQVERYLATGLAFKGDRNDPDGGWNGGNRVFGMTFTRIGSKHVAGEQGYGALDLVNSRDNDIRNNHFVAVENDPPTDELMHAVYLAHTSSGNVIVGNAFKNVSGDPIRARDGSDANVIEGNTFERTGIAAFYSDWYCDPDTNPNCTKEGGECPSWRNEFRDNELHCGYDGGDIATFAYIQGGADYVPPPCPDHFADGWKRLSTSGNVKSCP